MFGVTAAIQRSQASLAQLSRELGINPKTVAQWRKRATVEDRKTGSAEPGRQNRAGRTAVDGAD
jgi:transposase-like protein